MWKEAIHKSGKLGKGHDVKSFKYQIDELLFHPRSNKEP